MPIEPDRKDWTWAIQEPCPDCGLDAATVDRSEIAELIRANAARWAGVLVRDDVAARPSDSVWSPLEYACHVRDVHRLFDQRLRLMLEQDDPLFPNWDQDATAVEDDYAGQDPTVVGPQLRAAAEAVAATYASVSGAQWQRPGRRSNGTLFTVETMGRYHLHDAVHHIWDVRG